MLTVSPAFTTAMAATIRKPKARVTIVWTDPYIDPTIETSASDNNRVQYSSQVADLIEAVPLPYWHLDGTTKISDGLHPAPGSIEEAADYQMGWWSASACDGSGDFSTPPELYVEFSPRPILSLRVAGDDAWGEYPIDFTVKIYNGVYLASTVVVTGNTDPVWVYDISAEEINTATKMTLSISKWSAASRVAKICEFYSSIMSVYTGDDIMEMNILEEAEAKDGTIPIGNVSANELDLKLNNVDDKFFPGNVAATLYTLVKKNRRITAELGFELPSGVTEWVPMGKFWSGDWATSELGTSASTSARDRMELLRKSSFYTGVVYEGATLYALAETVLEHAKTIYADLEYTIDAQLADYTVPYAWLEKQSHFDALKKIVQACRGRAYCDRLGVVKILGSQEPSGASVLEITADNYFERQQPAQTDEIVNQVNVKTLPYQPKAATEDIYGSESPIAIAAGQTLTVNCTYQESPVQGASAVLLGATTAAISAASYYAWGADITIYSAAAESVKIKISGTKFEIVGGEIRTKTDAESIVEFGLQNYDFPDNKLIQSPEVADAIAEDLLEAYKIQRKDQTLDWRGHPALELGDPLTLPEFIKGAVSEKGIFYITKAQHSFDGSYRVSMDARKIKETVVAGKFQDTDEAESGWQDDGNAVTEIQDGDS